MPHIRTVPETVSTNDDVAALARDGAPEGTWLRADTQTGGRGRQGRVWVSPPGNVYASTLVRLGPGDPPAPTLALVAAVALHEAVAHLISPPFKGGAGGGWQPSGLDAREDALSPASSRLSRHPLLNPLPVAREGRLMIKWPNDLLLCRSPAKAGVQLTNKAGLRPSPEHNDCAKLAGILLEREGDAVVVGFGVNLAHHPDDIDRPATSIVAVTGSAPRADAALEMLAETFARWLARWRCEGLSPIRAAWLAAAHPIGTALSTSEGDALFDGLEHDGALRLRLADGTAHVIHAGDVFLI